MTFFNIFFYFIYFFRILFKRIRLFYYHSIVMIFYFTALFIFISRSSRFINKLFCLSKCSFLSLFVIFVKNDRRNRLCHMVYGNEFKSKHKLDCLNSNLIFIIIRKIFCISYKIISQTSNKSTIKFILCFI